jgi:sugar transferase (PEP-CTERM/EpsH1 system associated)
MAGYVMARKSGIRVLDMVDIDSEKWRAYAAADPWPARMLYRREADALFAFERRAVLAFDKTLFVSEPEASRFASLAPECSDRIGWLENGVDLDRFSPARSYPSPFSGGGRNIVFTGTMDYRPNIDAVRWFADAVLPLLRQEQPPIHFHIVGARPDRQVLRLGRMAGIHVTGRVDDVRPFLAHADLAVAPLRIARGIQNKVLEAMAMARPVLASPEAFEGVRAKPGRDLLVCAGAEEMRQRILEVMRGRHPGLGAAARVAVERGHHWSATLPQLDELFPREQRRSGREEIVPAPPATVG